MYVAGNTTSSTVLTFRLCSPPLPISTQTQTKDKFSRKEGKKVPLHKRTRPHPVRFSLYYPRPTYPLHQAEVGCWRVLWILMLENLSETCISLICMGLTWPINGSMERHGCCRRVFLKLILMVYSRLKSLMLFIFIN